ncbi:MAG: DsbA family protein [Rhodospirillales bacterium]|nr:DsbA family protein [Rhodospirillales bacterium]
MNKRHISTFFAAFALIGLAFSASAQTAIPAPRAEGLDMVMGAENAPITMIEYASLTCPHCAKLHVETMPRLKAEYIDTGKLKLVFRDFPLDRIALNAAMLARCAGPERYFTFLDVFFAQQANWLRGTSGEQIMASLRRLARTGGMTEAAMDQCLANTEMQNAVLSQAMTGEREHKVQATPTLVINGTVHRGGQSFEELDAILKPLAGSR